MALKESKQKVGAEKIPLDKRKTSAFFLLDLAHFALRFVLVWFHCFFLSG